MICRHIEHHFQIWLTSQNFFSHQPSLLSGEMRQIDHGLLALNLAGVFWAAALHNQNTDLYLPCPTQPAPH